MSSRVVLVSGGIACLTFGLGALLGARLTSRSVAPPIVASSGTGAAVRPAAAVPPGAAQEGFTGVIFPRQQVDLAPTVEARVLTVPAELGVRLRKGDVVATLDAESIRRELAAATASVRAAQAEVRAANVELSAARAKAERLVKLGDGVSAEELESARYQEKLAAARVEGARAHVGESLAVVDKLRTLLETTAILAPFDGVVAMRYVDPGTIVGPGRPIIRLISGDDVWVRFAVPEDQAGSVAVDGCVEVGVPSMGGSAAGVVGMVAPQIESASRMLFVEARLTVPPAWQGKLPVGLVARVRPQPCRPDPG